MIENKRQRDILEILEKKKFMRPTELADSLYVSISTIRRDLINLEKLGLIQRAHGEVSLFVRNEPAHLLRSSMNYSDKSYIAQIALSYIENGQTLFLDSSSTVNALCASLSDFKNLTIITNSIQNALDMASGYSNKVIVAGGTLKPNSVSLLGEATTDFLEPFSTDLAIISCKSLDEHGIYEEDYSQGHIKEAMIEKASKTILLTDNSKLGKKNLYRFAQYSDIDTAIFNEKPSDDFINACSKHGCDIVW